MHSAHNLERRVLHLHLPRQLQTGRPRLRNHRTSEGRSASLRKGSHPTLQKHFELTLKVPKQHRHPNLRPGVTKDQIDPAPREWRLFEKLGYFSANFLAQYEEDFSNPGLLVRLCRDGRLR